MKGGSLMKMMNSINVIFIFFSYMSYKLSNYSTTIFSPLTLSFNINPRYIFFESGRLHGKLKFNKSINQKNSDKNDNIKNWQHQIFISVLGHIY